MSSFVHVDQTLSHPGVARAEQVFGYVQEQRQALRGARGLGAVLLAAAVAAVIAVADKLVASWTDGSLMAAWMLLWLVVFLGMALFAGAARSMAQRALDAWQGTQRRWASARADAKLLETARHDPRVMSDLMAAVVRQTEEVAIAAPTAGAAAALVVPAVRMPTVYEAMRSLNGSRHH